MKAFCLAAGHGTRLKPITDTVPKCLVPIQGKPLLRIWLDIFVRYGITDVMINIHSHADVVRRFLEHEKTATNIVLAEEKELHGSAGTLRAHRDWIGHEDFWIFYADVLNAIDLGAMYAFHRQHPDSLATLGLYRVPDPKRCGIAELDANQVVVGFEEKPQEPKADLAFSGIMVGTKSMLDLIPDPEEVPMPDIGFDVLPRLIGKMYGYPIREYLIDIGTMKNYQEAQKTWEP
jgi:mannose-1-phosphate guanylyltransferase